MGRIDPGYTCVTIIFYKEKHSWKIKQIFNLKFQCELYSEIRIYEGGITSNRLIERLGE